MAAPIAYDVAIVGSGAGGGTLAAWLTAAGRRVLVLEAGQRHAPRDYPDNELDGGLQLMWGGGMELSRDGRLALLRGRTLGGGTVVNQALLDRLDEDALDDWVARSGIDDLSLNAMTPHYRAVEGQMHLQTIPREHWNRNARLYVEGFERLGHGWAPLRRGQSHCAVEQGNDCMRCLNGCPRGSKQSTAVHALPRAERAGACIETGVQVLGLVEGRQLVTLHGHRQGHPVQFHAHEVVLAAGALGTVELLLRSGFDRDLPRLGQGFYCHPQFMSFALHDQPVDAHKGSFQAVKSDDAGFRAAGFKLENVFAGPMSVAFLLPQRGRAHQSLMQRYRHLACIEVAVRDITPGHVCLRRGRLQVNKTLGPPERQRARHGRRIIHELFRATGARRILDSPQFIGLHLMGGAALGRHPQQAVVDPEFRLFGHPRIRVVDGSLFPSAPGINPSLTIMALAHRAAGIMTGGLPEYLPPEQPGC